ncbi:MAG: hypothetical protein Kow0010_25410 [Dehalococcoidia bacterium]
MDIQVEAGVAVVPIRGRSQPAERLCSALQTIYDGGEASVVLLNLWPGTEVQGFDGEAVRWLWRDYPLPAVCAFTGELAGTALNVALGADVRVCDTDASVRFGDGWDTLTAQRVRRLLQLGPAAVPPTRTVMGHRELLDRGLVSCVAERGRGLAEARRVAGVIASRGPVATRLAKEAIWRGLEMPLEQALRFETDLTLLLQTTKDRAEGVRAFLEKRQPHFIGE